MTNTALIVPASSPASTPAPAAVAFVDAPKPLIAIPNVWLWVICGLALLAILGMAFVLWWQWRHRPARIASPPIMPPHARARRKLELALTKLGDPKLFSTLVSSAIREYLEERFNFHAPERTTEEFLYELQSTSLLTADQKRSLGDFLASCDLIKFAKYEPTEVELRGLHSSALRLVNETEPRPAPEKLPSAPAEPPPLPQTQPTPP